MSKCLITGCTLYIPAEGKHVHGDLHSVAPGVFAFNAVLINGDTRWDHDGLNVTDSAKVVAVCGDYYEKRGVIAFSRESAEFNQAAITYLGKNL